MNGWKSSLLTVASWRTVTRAQWTRLMTKTFGDIFLWLKYESPGAYALRVQGVMQLAPCRASQTLQDADKESTLAQAFPVVSRSNKKAWNTHAAKVARAEEAGEIRKR